MSSLMQNAPSPAEPSLDPVSKRQTQFTERLLRDLGESREYKPDPEQGRCTLSNRRYRLSYQARLQHFHLSLLHGIQPDAANHYYETSPDLDSTLWNHPRNEPDWKLMPLTRAYFTCASLLSPAARQRIESLLLEGRTTIGFGGTENHIINRATLVYLIDQLLGLSDAKTARAKFVVQNWIFQRASRGFYEYHSPTYHRHSLLPLIELFDIGQDPEVRDAAKNLLDVACAALALTTLNGYRGGPWHRATNTLEIERKDNDITALVGHLFFDACPCPEIITEGGTWATTGYRPPEAVVRLGSNACERGSYEVFERIDGPKPLLNAIHWVTPHFILGSFTGAPGFTSSYYGSTNGANLQPWELTFGRLSGSIGPKRSDTDVTDANNRNTSFWQYRNVLFFRGEWAFYGSLEGKVLSATHGSQTMQVVDLSSAGIQLFLRVFTDSTSGLGILEVCEIPQTDWTAQEELDRCMAMVWEASEQDGNAQQFRYQPEADLKIEYNAGKATVNGVPCPTSEFPLIQSPWLNSSWDSGVAQWHSEEGPMAWEFRPAAPGFGDGLVAEYEQAGKRFERVDKTLDYYWGNRIPVTGMEPGPFIAKWKGFYRAPYSERLTFHIQASGPLRFELAGKLLIDSAEDPTDDPIIYEAEFEVIEGAIYPMAITLDHCKGKSCMVARWSGIFEKNSALGLTGELFHQVVSKA